MKNLSEFNSFLNALSTQQLEDIKSDIIKIHNGNFIYYVADTFDIINYSMPFIERHINVDSPNYLSQKTIAYESIFLNNSRFNFSLPDEYKSELISIKNNLNIKLNNFPRIRQDLLEKLKDDNQSDYEKLLNENIELLTVVFIFANLGNNVYKRFNDFLINNLNITNFKAKNKNHESIVNLCFANIRQSTLTTELFTDFVDENRLKLLSYSNDIERYCYLDNTYRDIIVVDRLHNINKKLNNKNIYFHYLSSAPVKTNKIFEILKKNKKNEFYGFNRNIMQLFLLNFLLENKFSENDAVKHIDYLKEIKSTENIVDDNSKNSFQMIEFASSINKTFINYRLAVEKGHFYNSYIKYKNEIEKAINELKINKNKNIIIGILEKIKSVEQELADDTINDNFYSLKKLFYLSLNFSPSKIHLRIFNVKPGKDIIRNTFHHLPLLPFLATKKNTLIDSFNHLLNNLSNEPKIIGVSTKKFFDSLTLVISEIGKVPSINTLSHHNSLLIILSYLNILTDDIEFVSDEIEPVIITELENSINLEKESSIRGRLDLQSNTLKVESKGSFVYSYDIGYILLWLYRRQKMFNKATSLAKKLLKVNNKDPRIYHGLALTYHSKAYDCIESNLEEAKNNFDLSYTLFEKSIGLYIDYHSYSKVEEIIINKQIIAILNSLIDNNLRRYELKLVKKEQNILIRESRFLLTLLKDYLNKLPVITDNYDSLETINHTEAELEYYEAEILYHKNDLINALHKINMSTERINNFANSNILVPDYFKSIVSKVNRLRIKIYKKLNYI